MTRDELDGATLAHDSHDATVDRAPPFTAVVEKIRSALLAWFAPPLAVTTDDSVLPDGANVVAGSTALDAPRWSFIDEQELGQSIEAHRVLAATATATATATASACAEQDDNLDAKMRARRLQLHERAGLDG